MGAATQLSVLMGVNHSSQQTLLKVFFYSLKIVKLDPDPAPHCEKVTEKQLVPDPQITDADPQP